MTELILGSFIAGLLLTFTPCVLPMVPIISGIIVGQGKNLTTKKAVMLSVAYVLGTAATYTVMGALAGATGEQLQSYFQNVWVIGTMSLVFVFMALSMFGLFTLQLPSFIQSKLNASTDGMKGGSLPMVFLLGMISALILGACVSPVLISFLGVAIAKGDAVLGGLMMFSMAIGMGIPLILLGFGAGKLLPKAGMWMDMVKYVFGVLLMAVAIQLFSTLDLVSELLLWGVFIIILAIYMGSIDTLKENQKLERFLKSVGVVLLIWGSILLVGAAKGNKSLIVPLEEPPSIIQSNNTTPQTIAEKKEVFYSIHNMRELEAKQAEAKEKNKPLVIYFYSDYCSLCLKLKATTFKDTDVQNILADSYIAIKLNMSNKSDEAMLEVKKHFKVFGTPAFIFFDDKGERIDNEATYGYQEPEEFADTLDLMM